MKKIKLMGLFMLVSVLFLFGCGAEAKEKKFKIKESRMSGRNIYVKTNPCGGEIQMGSLDNEETATDYYANIEKNGIFATARLDNADVYWVRTRTGILKEDELRNPSKWTKKTWFVPQPLFAANELCLKEDSLKIAWDENNHAGKYYVYVRKDDDAEWTKIATTKNTNYEIRAFQDEKIDVRNHSYEVAIVPYVKIGKKWKHSNKDYYMTVARRENGSIDYDITETSIYEEAFDKGTAQRMLFGIR